MFLFIKWLFTEWVRIYTPQTKSRLPSVFENKVLLEYSHAHSLVNCHGGFYTKTTKLNNCNRDAMACKAEKVYCLTVCSKRKRQNFADR